MGRLPCALLVRKVHVVDPPGRSYAGHLRVLFLLPVEPPEIDALFLQRMEDEVEVVFGEFLVGDVIRNVLLRRRIDAHGPSHRRIRCLPRLNAGSGCRFKLVFK